MSPSAVYLSPLNLLVGFSSLEFLQLSNIGNVDFSMGGNELFIFVSLELSIGPGEY